MDNNEIKELFSNMYNDFFGIEKLTEKNFENIVLNGILDSREYRGWFYASVHFA